MSVNTVFKQEIKLDRIDQILIYVSNLERSERFYREMLGIDEELLRLPHAVFLRCGSVNLLLDEVPRTAAPEHTPEIYFRVDDIQQTYELLAHRGVTFRSVPAIIGRYEEEEVWMAGFTDPDGQRLYLICNKSQG